MKADGPWGIAWDGLNLGAKDHDMMSYMSDYLSHSYWFRVCIHCYWGTFWNACGDVYSCHAYWQKFSQCKDYKLTNLFLFYSRITLIILMWNMLLKLCILYFNAQHLQWLNSNYETYFKFNTKYRRIISIIIHFNTRQETYTLLGSILYQDTYTETLNLVQRSRHSLIHELIQY